MSESEVGIPPEILEELTKPFPPRLHKERRIKGGDKWYYVPWEAYTRRLNKVCGNNWSMGEPKFHMSGDYHCWTVSITIFGVTRWGVGTDKIFPDRNDQGKEKIIGDPLTNPYRGALVDALYLFGIGAYIFDDQNQARELYFQGVKGYAAERQEAAQAQNSHPPKTNSAPAPKPARKTVQPDPAQPKNFNKQRVGQAWKNSGLDQSEVEQLIYNLELPPTDEMSVEQVDQLIAAVEEAAAKKRNTTAVAKKTVSSVKKQEVAH